MTRRSVRDRMQELSQRYGLGYDEVTKSYLGMHRGILVHVSETYGVMTLVFVPEGDPFGTPVAEAFTGFRHCEEAGLPLAWLELVLLTVPGTPKEHPPQKACQVTIGKHRLAHTGVTTFMALPDLVAQDLRGRGAPEFMPCMKCRGREATEAAFIYGAYTALCSECQEASKHLVPRKTSLGQHVAAFAVLVVLLGLVVWGIKCNEEPPVATSYNRGLRAIQQGDAEVAIAAFNEAIAAEPGCSDAYALRGEAYCMLGQFEQGIADYSEAIRLVETGAAQAATVGLPLIYNDRGLTYHETGDLDRAIADCSKAIELDPNYALAYNNRGHALAAKGRFDEAIADYGQAIRLDRSDFRPFLNRGIAFLEKREHNQALPDLEEVIRLKPQCALAWDCRADVRLHRGKYKEALADANHALHLAPALPSAHVHRFVATVSLRLGELGDPGRMPATSAGMGPRNDAEGSGTDMEGPRPPSARRVVGRAIVLSALVYRSFLDHYAGSPDGDELRSRLFDWLVATGLVWELEQEERKLLATPLGRAEDQAIIDAEWRVEGLAVLAWALGRFELPPHDERVRNYLVATDAVGFLGDKAMGALLLTGTLRPSREIRAFANQITMVSWRLTQLRTNPSSGGFMDLQEFPAYCVIEGWLKGLRLVDGELAVGDRSLTAASDAERQMCNSIARERHIAAYWLEGDDETYSRISPDTMPLSAAMLESQRGDPDIAIRVCTAFLEQDPTSATWLAQRGWAYIRKGSLANALADLHRAVELEPDASRHEMRAWAFLHSGYLASADRDAREALRLAPKDPWPHLILFRTAAARGEEAKAVRAARCLLDAAPAEARAIRPVLRYLLGEVRLDTLRDHPSWNKIRVAVRGYTPMQPDTARPGR
ncbi:MAG: DUF4272 domain-containing protein [Candidatus Brocadiae bacterium]|nr:DUF4272 domain-containing protein [Candidatus Brocadiia bacterium]